jgi:hypothetical protein
METENLPSGNTISGDTWAAIKAAGDWRGFLDARMYPQSDRDHMDRALGLRA